MQQIKKLLFAIWIHFFLPLLQPCARFWNHCHYWNRILRPARASLLAAILAVVLFNCMDQGKEVLRRLVANDSTPHLISNAVLFLIGLCLVGLAGWGWARLLLNCEFDTTRGTHESELANQVRRWVRRIYGILPAFGLVIAFVRLAFEEQSAGRARCLLMAALCAAVGTVLYLYFERVRKQARASRFGAPMLYLDRHDIKRDKDAFRPILLATAASAVTFIVFTAAPVPVGNFFGSPAVLLFALAAWISGGSWLIYFGERYRVPIFSVLLIAAVIFSLWNDNHQIRLLGHDDVPPKEFADALDEWHAGIIQKYPTATNYQPLYLVAAAGGGIRAACWTAAILARIEDEARKNHSSFAEHTFAMSGVSGGSLGEVTFVTLLAHPPAAGTLQANAADRLDHDFLSADLSRMAFGDLLQRFLPFHFHFFDRATALEDSWTCAWPGLELDTSLNRLYLGNPLLPHLLLNGTSVQSGQRIITSDLVIRPRFDESGRPAGEFLNALSGDDLLKHNAIRLSTAAHQSARFTYFSPAGTFPGCGQQRVVDGGYFENSGATTLMDVLWAVQRHAKARGWSNVVPFIVLIDNDPGIADNLPKKKSALDSLLSETLSPIFALLNTRDARGNYAGQLAADRQNWTNGWAGTPWPATGTNVFSFHIRKTEIVPPLGWTLAPRSIAEMERQLADQNRTVAQIIATLPSRN